VTASDQSTGQGDVVVAITSDDHWAHAYTDEGSALAEKTFGRPGEDGDIHFFDATGRSLTPVYGSGGELTGFRDSAGPADPEAVRRRLRAVIAYAHDFLREQPTDADASIDGSDLSVEQAEQQLPDLDGGSLDDDLRRARSLLGPHPMAEQLQNRGSFLHNLLVHGLRT
jgi:hypothetical protein